MDEKVKDKGKAENGWSCWFWTVIAGSGAIVQILFMGINEAQTAMMLSQLKSKDSLIHINPDEETWIVSLEMIASPISCMITGPFIDAFGRKRGLQIFFLITALGYQVMFSAQTVYHIYAARIISGICSGMTSCAVVYMGEICTAEQRKYFFAITTALHSGGYMVASVVCGLLPWQIAALIFSFVAVVLLICQYFTPESPPWLFKQGQEHKSVQSFRALRRSESAIQLELKTLKLSCNEARETFKFQTFLDPTVWKPFLIMVTFFFLQNTCGGTILLNYLVDVINRLGTTYDPVFVSVLVSTSRFLSSCTLGVLLWSIFGRKFLTAFSGFWMMVAFVGMGMYVYLLRDVRVLERPYQWVPVASLVLYSVSCDLGVGSLPFVLTGELFPLRVRGTMACACQLIANVFMFVSAKSYYLYIEALGFQGLLFTFAGSSCIVVLFGLYVLPETRNKSLFEIGQGFLPVEKRLTDTGVSPAAAKYGSIT